MGTKSAGPVKSPTLSESTSSVDATSFRPSDAHASPNTDVGTSPSHGVRSEEETKFLGIDRGRGSGSWNWGPHQIFAKFLVRTFSDAGRLFL